MNIKRFLASLPSILGLICLCSYTQVLSAKQSKTSSIHTTPIISADFRAKVRPNFINNPKEISLVSTIKEDIKIPVMSGTDTSHHKGEGISKSFDGDFQTIYHSNWNNSIKDYYPITLTYYFKDIEEVDYLIYYPRTSGYNGHFKDVDILYSTDGVHFIPALSKNFSGRATPTRISFPSPIKAKSFRFIVRSGGGDGQGFVACTEMEFYRNNPDRFNPKEYFTDGSCSELKPGITKKNIRSIDNPFFRDLAQRISNNNYQREFRITEYKPWLDPSYIALIDKINPYSIMDNPTGIYVDNDEELLVCVGDTHGFDDLSIVVQNLDAPNGDGFNTRATYPLHEGINKIKVHKKGLIYVMYHAYSPQILSELKPIRIHFATGKVNGFFDSQNPIHEGRWIELLSQTICPYFDVLGKHAHLTFPVDYFRQNTPDGKALIDIYDKIVNSEKELLGFYKYHTPTSYRLPQNRMYLNVMYHNYMYATSYHTAYVNTTMPELTNTRDLSTTAIWGPSHEIGHMNQTRPGMMWKGMTECTVNISSQYVQTYIFNQPSRLQTEDVEGNSYYSKAFSKLLASNIPFCNAGDVFEQLVPFWQLELYFGKVLGNTPAIRSDKGGFYPDIYEYVRTHPDLTETGLQQTELPYIASSCAQVDLTDFFEYWGFFRPVEQEIDDYGKDKIVVTESRVNEVKSRIKALNLPKSNLAIEYITDHNSDLFKEPQPIIAGLLATYSEDVVSIKGWRNVVAFEVYDEANRLIFVADASYPHLGDTQFKLNSPMKPSYKIKAVSVRRERLNVPIR